MEDKRLTGWTEERVALLKKMWSEGATAAEIAKALGFEKRNPVCGKIDRLGLGRKGVKVARSERDTIQRRDAKANLPPPKLTKAGTRRKTLVSVKAIKAAKARSSSPELTPEPFVIRCVEVVSLHLDINDLNETTCHWPELDGPEQTYCGMTVKAGKPYCPDHCDIAYKGVPQRPPSMDRASWTKGRGGVFGRAA